MGDEFNQTNISSGSSSKMWLWIVLGVIVLIFIGGIFIFKGKSGGTKEYLQCDNQVNIAECQGKISKSISYCDKTYSKESFDGVTVSNKVHCYIGVAEGTNDAAPCLSLKSKDIAGVCILTVAYNTRDYNKCLEIKKLQDWYKESTDNMIDSCLLNFPLVVPNWTDSKACEYITNPDDKASCMQYTAENVK